MEDFTPLLEMEPDPFLISRIAKTEKIPYFFHRLTKDEIEIPAYVIKGIGFISNDEDVLFDQITDSLEEGGFSFEIGKINKKKYIKKIFGIEEEYLKLHPEANKDKLGILYLVFNDEEEILGEVGYREEALEYVPSAGLIIVPVIYEVGVDLKDARLELSYNTLPHLSD